MRQALAERRALLTVPSPEIAQLVRQDPLGLFDLMREQLGGAQAGLNIGITERRLRHRGRPPPAGDRAADAAAVRRRLLARAVRAARRRSRRRWQRRRADAEAGRRAAAAARRWSSPAATASRIETESLVRRESISNTVGSLALILPLLFLVFRSPWLVAVGSLPSAISLLLVLGALGFAGATLSAAATASAAMLFGLGVDGVVLLYVALYARARQGPASRTARSMASTGPSYSMLLGMWTTAATFYGLVFVDFPSLEQLGRLIGHSMVLCGVLTLVLVPAPLPRTRRGACGAVADDAAGWRAWVAAAPPARSWSARRSSPSCSARRRPGCGSTRRWIA